LSRDQMSDDEVSPDFVFVVSARNCITG